MKEKWRISTEDKIVGVDDILLHYLWSRYFVVRQGYSVEELNFNQDNMRDILM